jgi:hypothetical protein
MPFSDRTGVQARDRCEIGSGLRIASVDLLREAVGTEAKKSRGG